MASINKTENLNLSQYTATDKPAWLTDYNADMATLDAAISASGVAPARISKSGTHHTVTCEGGYDTVKFTATSDFEPDDTFECNGSRLPVLTAEGEAYTVPAWKAGDAVVLTLQPESARVLAPMANKANLKAVQTLPLEYAAGFSGTARVMKTQENMVFIFGLISAEGSFARSQVFATLPDGIRPLEQQNIIIFSSGYTGGVLRVETNGKLYFANVASSTMNLYYLDFGFVAK